MFPRTLFAAVAALCTFAAAHAQSTYWYTAGNAIVDNNHDGTGDAFTPNSPNYVENYYQSNVGPSGRIEYRSFAQFTLPTNIGGTFNHATLSFTAVAGNGGHLPPQQLDVYGYVDPAAGFALDDFTAAGTLLGTTTPIPGYTTFSQLNTSYSFNFDITSAFTAATNQHAQFYNIRFQNPVVTVTNSSDFYGFSSLVSVGNFHLTTSNETPQAVPDRSATFWLGLIAVGGVLLWHRFRSRDRGRRADVSPA